MIRDRIRNLYFEWYIAFASYVLSANFGLDRINSFCNSDSKQPSLPFMVVDRKKFDIYVDRTIYEYTVVNKFLKYLPKK